MGYYFYQYSTQLRTPLLSRDKYPKRLPRKLGNYGKIPPWRTNVIKTEILKPTMQYHAEIGKQTNTIGHKRNTGKTGKCIKGNITNQCVCL